ncbi:MAG: alpha/beta hydrolase [Clostridiales bacterium]|nr:alpha/beta hydrolase [Clostridiales bacterium]
MEHSKPISLHFIQKGEEGFPLILLHGNDESGIYFEHQIEPFARHARVFAVDTRGHGQSPRGEGPFTLSRFAEDLAAFMDAQAIPQADVLGFSDGGNIAILFALRYPQRVRKLVLNGANLQPWGVCRRVQIPLTLHYGWICVASACRPGLIPRKEMLGLMIREPHIPTRDMQKIKAPTLVIAGDHDLIRTSHTRSIARALPNSVLCILPGDHFLAHKKPDAFNEVVTAFLWG